MRRAPNPAIDVHGLSKLCLRNVSLRVADGERVAIVGRSGAGKTILLRSIVGLLQPERGTVRVFGHTPRPGASELAGLGVAFQSPGLFDMWSIRENLLTGTENRVSDEELRAGLAEIGLQTISLDRSTRNLSGGQQKRIALMRAMLRAKRLLVLDEPTSGLDPDTASRVAVYLDQAMRRSNITLLMITHDYEVAERICDHIYLLTSSGELQPLEERSETAIRTALQSTGTQTQNGTADEPAAWGTAAAAEDFVSQALPLSVTTMFPLGAMMVAQTAGMVSFDISPRIPGGLVTAVFREIAPLVVGLLVSARVSSRVSAEVAGMSYTAQLDSMRLLGVSRMRTVIAPFVVAAALVFPLCILVGGAAAVAGGATLAAVGMRRLTIGAGRFLSLAMDAVEPATLGACMIKGILAGIIVAALSYTIASRPVDSASGLGDAVTRSTVTGAVCIILIDIVVSWCLLP